MTAQRIHRHTCTRTDGSHDQDCTFSETWTRPPGEVPGPRWGVYRVSGWDISLHGTGVCLPDGATYTINTTKIRGDKRLTALREAALYYATRCGPGHGLAVIEQALPGIGGGSAATALAIGMAQGVVREALAFCDITTAFVAIHNLKRYVTGSGSADKAAIIAAMDRHAGRRPGDDNQADAYWLRAMGMRWVGAPIDEDNGQVDVGGNAVRHACVFGPWRGGRPGAVWPDQGARRLPTDRAAP